MARKRKEFAHVHCIDIDERDPASILECALGF